ncbi:aminopeptidase N isoform X1 [Pyrgilauda ruficollis]|uniref:aminopeptidase N isoform X1 n=2 Tax=Pyrgilauda ruficollis TaxID=221976 RepID=UPI001B85D1B8|nr:aminopeptidase N isoform X1 [Pyrgilauda ruficollis]XP_041320992.1 aminopeptidase N isoform X1 [Pyrgilauda ruficollis]XP_041320993.1 aminopeptidase N isoform X1 [Pyrgilauda ruficollis]
MCHPHPGWGPHLCPLGLGSQGRSLTPLPPGPGQRWGRTPGSGTQPAHAPRWCHPPLPALPLQQRRRALLLPPAWGAGGWKAHPRVCRRPEPHAHLILHPLTWANKPRGSERLKAVLASAPSLPVPLLLPAMAGGFFISKTVGIVAIVLGLGAVATIIALSVVYAQEKNKGTSDVGSSTTASPNITTTTTPAPNNPWNRWRLPASLKPEFYEVSLQPFLKPDANNMYIFKGNSSVVFLCEEATNLILIHSKKLNYTMQGSFHATLQAEGGGSAPAISSTWLEDTTQYLVVQLAAPLQQGQRYRLFSSFTGELADDLAGFYRSEYTDESNTKQVVATTQMQAADARKAFPCFDEPAMKANFTVTLIHPSGYGAISNMPAKNTRDQEIDGEIWHVTEFYTTPRMSTYLLAFIVSQFTNVERNSNGTLIRIWGRPKAIAEGQGDYALNVTGPILSFFEKHYNTSYPLPKSDQVGLPDFNAGAMENWGLVTYRENSLLFDASYSSIGNKERVVTVIAHELAHQWFGNLVTLRWWNDLWLNEGFASYVEYLGADSAEPTWNIKDLMVLNELHAVMATDALASSHPLSFREDEINTPAQISEVFDTIAYSKGASVLRMLSSFLSEDIFKEGLQSYLHTFSYSNTIYADLWVHLQQAVDKNSVKLPESISNIMDRWTLQMGFPVVTVDTRSGTVSQAHFLLDSTSSVDRPSVFNYTWIVPITWMTGSGQGSNTYWLTKVTDTYTDFRVNTPNWLLLNLNVTGYFRVNYNQENWDQLLKQLDTNHMVFPVINRAQIIDDAFNLARAKYISVTLALNTTRFLSQETEYMPWQAALSNLKYFQQMFDRSEVFGAMSKYIKKQVTPLFEYYQKITNNWENIPSNYPLMVQYNEANAISTACSFGVTACQNLAINYLRRWQNSTTNPVPPNLRSAIYCSMVATGGEDAWDFLWEKFKEAHVVSEADKLRTALSCSPHPWILNRYLQYTLDPTKIRKQDATSTINSIASNVVGQPLAWDFIRGNWRTLFTQYGGGSFSFSRLILAVTQRFSSEFELQQLEQFKKDNQDIGFGSGTRALEQALEQTRANIKWVEENRAAVLTWFESESKSG